MKISKKYCSLALCLLMFCSSPATAHASTNNQDIVQKLTNYGVAQTVAQSLAEKLIAGEIWDSLDGTSVPVNTETARVAGFDETVNTFSDGSISVTKTEVPTSIYSRASLSKCKTASGTGYVNYSNCLVVRDSIVFLMAFTTDFSIHPGPYNDTINRVYNQYFGSCFLSCSELTLTLNQKIESATSPANARLQMAYYANPIWATIVWVDLRVGNETITLREG